MKEILNHLFEYKTLSKEISKEVLMNLAQGKYNNSQVASFITVFLMRSVTVEELSGFREAMMELCIPLDVSAYNTIDVCGTGGDAKDSFNISTITSFIVAGSGQMVVKHGNYGVSSVSGSSNVLQYYGYNFTNDSDFLIRKLETCNICFLHAPLFHPAMKNVAPVRKDLGVKTFFNMLGPMVNPANPNNQFVGVFSLELARLYGYLYQSLNKNYSIIHSLDGYDEISLTGNFKVIGNDGERILNPKDINMSQYAPEDLYGGETVEEAAKIVEKILNGKGSKAQNEVVIANAIFALITAQPTLDIATAKQKAEDSLFGGKAKEMFLKLLS
ncbi:MAG: anthranilate phosphoribosyltransferase [Thermoflexibacter sp.]|jgi:anthranilate phosphoribosyltransferase|nr:anthranilate phosphoribosyltransferase [Thermoflexibacter sp.]